MRRRWNHNIHYHPKILQAVPNGAERALDIGCGEGMLARELRSVVPEVTGIDLDTPSLELARGYDDGLLRMRERPAAGSTYRRHLLYRYSITWKRRA